MKNVQFKMVPTMVVGSGYGARSFTNPKKAAHCIALAITLNLPRIDPVPTSILPTAYEWKVARAAITARVKRAERRVLPIILRAFAVDCAP